LTSSIAVGSRVEGDAELPDALGLAQRLLDGGREDVAAADDEHVVAAPEDALRPAWPAPHGSAWRSTTSPVR
jgi:hypothetical protein